MKTLALFLTLAALNSCSGSIGWNIPRLVVNSQESTEVKENP